MRMPDQLRTALDRVAAGQDFSALRRASAEISAAYKSADLARPALHSSTHRIAYVLVRMPATYAANVHVLRSLKASAPELSPRSLLDLGAGPGTSAWALAETFPEIEKCTLVERDLELIKLGRSLAQDSSSTSLQLGEWSSADITSMTEFPPADIVVISYAIGELGAKARSKLVEDGWAAAKQALVVIEPGTKRGFEIVLGVRKQLISMNAKIAAPCPHMQQCPMAAKDDWCHFAQRIERGSEHRRLKDASLGYEDEKFSYVVASRLPVSTPRARVVRHPQVFSGYVKLELCAGPVLEHTTVTRSQGSSYKKARHVRWGDDWNF